MKNLITVICLSLIMSQASVLYSQKTEERLTGSWIGHIVSSSMEIRLVFHISSTAADTLMATLDSPDQSVEGLKLGRVTNNDTIIRIDAPALKIQYNGVLKNDTLIKGTWTQGGRDFPLDISKMKGPLKDIRPQEPVPPFPYRSEEVRFRNNTEGFELAGTLTIPEGKGPFPAVVLITGSGYQDRNETVFNHKPFLVISDYLTRNGIAVLRYDDRGTASSGGNRNNATSENLASDAYAAVEYLASRPEINHQLTGLAGHSEGSLIAAITAANHNDIAFIVSLAGPGIRGEDLILRQTKDIMSLSGADTASVNEYNRVMSHLYNIIVTEKDQKSAYISAMQWFNTYLDGKGVPPEKRKDETAVFVKSVVAANNPWFRYFLATDPKQFWAKVKCPVLALNGEKDLQVYYRDNLAGISEGIKSGGNKQIKTMSFAGLNHLFQHCKTGLTTEYATIEETFSPEVLKVISGWISDTAKSKK